MEREYVRLQTSICLKLFERANNLDASKGNLLDSIPEPIYRPVGRGESAVAKDSVRYSRTRV